MHILLNVPTLNVKDVNKDFDISEDVVPLAGEIVLHESFLPVRTTEQQGIVLDLHPSKGSQVGKW